MEANAGLVAGSHNKNQLVVIHGHETERPLRQLSGRVCQICGDDVGVTPDGELFIACHECGFPVCRPCYEYERIDGNQACPQCKTRYKRHKGSPRVEGDDDEDDVDDLDNEFNIDLDNNEKQQIAEAMLHGHMSYGRGNDHDMPRMVQTVEPQVPFLMSSQSVSSDTPAFPEDHHALVPSLVGCAKRVHPLPYPDPNLSGPARILDSTKDISSYGYGSVAWKERVESWKYRQGKMQMISEGARPNDGRQISEGDDHGDDDQDLSMMDEARQPLSRKVNISSAKINPYRMIIVMRLVVLGFFFRYRILNPVPNAYGLWLTSIICEIWFALSWILDQFPKWFPINRETYLDRLALRYDRDGEESSRLSAVDIFVSTVDPMKEPPLVTANTVLSILAVDYPVEKVSCYVSDDGAAMLTFESLSETSEFARRWVPFCKKFSIEPRAPEVYFAQKIDYLKDKVQPTFVKERRAMKREYEEYKVRINALVAKAQKVPEEGWTMQDGTPWPGNNTRDHPGMIQVFLGHSGGHDTEGNELPRLVYVSREKRPGFAH
eukprot:c22707_g3_i1 orf=364-2007(+)